MNSSINPKHKRRTALIERFHYYGTPRYGFVVSYRGATVRWREGNADVWAQTAFDDAEAMEYSRKHAKAQGFTHCRIAGDWSGRTKPKGGKL